MSGVWRTKTPIERTNLIRFVADDRPVSKRLFVVEKSNRFFRSIFLDWLFGNEGKTGTWIFVYYLNPVCSTRQKVNLDFLFVVSNRLDLQTGVKTCSEHTRTICSKHREYNYSLWQQGI